MSVQDSNVIDSPGKESNKIYDIALVLVSNCVDTYYNEHTGSLHLYDSNKNDLVIETLSTKYKNHTNFSILKEAIGYTNKILKTFAWNGNLYINLIVSNTINLSKKNIVFATDYSYIIMNNLISESPYHYSNIKKEKNGDKITINIAYSIPGNYHATVKKITTKDNICADTQYYSMEDIIILGKDEKELKGYVLNNYI